MIWGSTGALGSEMAECAEKPPCTSLVFAEGPGLSGKPHVSAPHRARVTGMYGFASSSSFFFLVWRFEFKFSCLCSKYSYTLNLFPAPCY